MADKQNQKEVKQLQTLVDYSRKVWGDNAVEFLVGTLSTVVSSEQIQVLIDSLKLNIKMEKAGKYGEFLIPNELQPAEWASTPNKIWKK